MTDTDLNAMLLARRHKLTNPTDPIDAWLARNLSTRARNKYARTGVLPTKLRKQFVERLLEDTFEMVGGVPRFSRWSNDPENYALFLQILVAQSPKKRGELVALIDKKRRENVTSVEP